jgi:putative membrane protein
MTKLYNYLSLILIGSYIIYLNLINRLVFLIHPRYVWLTLGSAAVITIVGAVGIFYFVQNKNKELEYPQQYFNWNLLILVLAFGVFFVPIKSLSTESFALRSTDSIIRLTDDEKRQLKQKISSGVDSTSFKFFDWVNAKNLNENRVFKDKKVKVSGFVAPGSSPSMFNLSRFVISCCVVDATPVSLMVEYSSYNQEFKSDEWVEVEGIFAIKTINGKSEPVIIPNSIIKIPNPDNIYLNRN